MIDFACPNCGNQFSLADEYAGKRVACKKCRHAMVVPEPEPVLTMAFDGIEPEAGEPVAYEPPVAAPTLPPPAVAGWTPRGVLDATIPDYTMLYLLGALLTACGLVALLLVLLLLGIIAYKRLPFEVPQMALLAGLLTWGLLYLAGGQALHAYRDIARNSWYQRAWGRQ